MNPVRARLTPVAVYRACALWLYPLCSIFLGFGGEEVSSPGGTLLPPPHHSRGHPCNDPVREETTPAHVLRKELGAVSRSPLNPAYPAGKQIFRSPREVRLSGVSPSQSAFLVCWESRPELPVCEDDGWNVAAWSMWLETLGKVSDVVLDPNQRQASESIRPDRIFCHAFHIVRR